MKENKNIELMGTRVTDRKKLTASERRFAKEIELMTKMSLSDLMRVEKVRMPIGV